jgi:hypothetical protein
MGGIMNITKAPEEILDAMKEHEQAIADLYELYARKFPEYEDFWTELSREEVQYAGWLEKLQYHIENSAEDFVVERFPVGAIEHSTEFVKKQMDTAQQPDFFLINALSTALRLEEALMESKYFEVLETDSAKTKHTLTMLAQSTQAHYQKVRKLWQEHE